MAPNRVHAWRWSLTLRRRYEILAGTGCTVLSVIVCSIDPRKQQAIRGEYQRAIGEPHEFILIDDARSLCEGYNRGFAQSCGEIVVFSHDDIEIHSRQLGALLGEALKKLDLLGVAGTSRLAGAWWHAAGRPYLHGRIIHNVKGRRQLDYFGPPSDRLVALDGVFFAARRAVCAALPFDEVTFDGFHLYDLDFSHRAFLSGFKVGILDIDVTHYSEGSFDSQEWRRYAQRFLAKHRRSIRAKPARYDEPQWTVTPL